MSGVALFGETLIKAALADEDGQALDKAIAELGPANSMSPLSALGRGPRATSYLALASAMSEAIRQAQLQFHSRYYADCHVSEAVDMTKGVLLRIFMLEGQRHHGELLYDWLLRRAREMGITGGAAFREIAGYGRHERLHEQFFFELAGDLPVEVVFAMTQSDSQKFLDLLAREKLSLFYISSPCEFGHVGE